MKLLYSTSIAIAKKFFASLPLIALPVISGNQVQRSLTANEGTPTEVTCSVRSRPASTLTWSADTGEIGIPLTPTVQRDGFYLITTGRYNLTNPAYTMDGKKINCTGVPVFGSAVTTVTTLNILCKFLPLVIIPEFSKVSFNTLWKIIVFWK